MHAMGLSRLLARLLGAGVGIGAGAAALTGCSLIYSPGNLPSVPADAADAPGPPDAPFDPDQLAVDAVAPGEMFEGQGVDGSRQVVLAITGANIAPDAKLTLVPEDPASPAAMIQVDNDHAVHSKFGGLLAVPITLPIDVASAGADIALAVQVTQSGSAGQVVEPPLKGHLVLHTLPELTALPAAATPLAPQYSRVAIGDWAIAPRAAASATVVRSWSSITIGNVSANAAGATPGPGGAGGGSAGQNGAGFGGGLPGNVLSGLLAGGGGAGFSSIGGKSPGGIAGGAANGDAFITSLARNFASGGGGGGGLGAAKGGGGGGTILLTAKGTLEVGALSATGGTGDTGSLLAAGGGGGAGGVIVLRAWAGATLGAITVAGGHGGNPTGGVG
ncbi:MAG TPA: hypothetical protein VFP84_31440, partial [Kofleriaceae bacterium]|nr:hypothetical protein [Kofleriaceae bacterium]